MRRIACLALVLCLSIVGMVHAQTGPLASIQGTFVPGGEPIDFDQFPAAKNSVPDFALLLPYFVVDTTSGSGVTTLFALRNRSASTEVVEINFFDQDGTLVGPIEGTLGPNETITINMRDVAGSFTPSGGFVEGLALINVNESTGGPSDASATVLTGDQFVIDPANNSADGDTLASALGAFCNRWDSRYLNGGPFSGGTVMRLTVLSPPAAGGTLAMGNVYDEDGNFAGNLTLTGNGNQVGLFDTSTVGGLPAFGSIEFNFTASAVHLTTVMSAEGRYSLGMRGFCAD